MANTFPHIELAECICDLLPLQRDESVTVQRLISVVGYNRFLQYLDDTNIEYSGDALLIVEQDTHYGRYRLDSLLFYLRGIHYGTQQP
jgi:hypothetical protein